MRLYLLFYPILGLACSPHSPSQAPPARPNIILFYADDLGWGDLGIQGSDYYETPHIDRIGQRGIRFTQAYANGANCAPSRACLMTGLYPPRHGIYTVGKPDRGQAIHRQLIPIPNQTVLDTGLMTLPAFLKEQGYQTCMAGKWHLSPDPTEYGFDANFGGYQAGHPRAYFSPYQNPYLSDGPKGEHLPARLAWEVSHWMRQRGEAPFFIYLPFYSVHTPIQGREDLIKYYGQKSPGEFHHKPEYAAMIHAMDEAVGTVMATLAELKLTEETLVIFTSDNGAHGGQSLSRPLRGSKGMFYEGGIRVPFLVQWPGIIPAASVNHSPIIGLDVFPTIAELVVANRPKPQMDGLSLWPLFTRQDSLPPRALYWHFPAYLQMYAQDRAFEDSHDKPWFRASPLSVIRSGNWKLLQFFETGELELYRLDTDPGEQHNLAATEPALRQSLLTQLQNWQQATQAAIPYKRNPAYQFTPLPSAGEDGL